MGDGYLHKYFLRNGGKRLHKWTHYFDIYERHFERFRGKSPKMLEIGVYGGGSLDMWSDYFGKGAHIVGLDIKPQCAQYARPGVDVVIGSQADPEVLDKLHTDFGPFDIVLDDGSHQMEHMIASFEGLYDRLAPDSVYMVEDTHACFNPKYGGGLGVDTSFLEFVKKRMDDLHASRVRELDQALPFAAATQSINVYDGIVAFERLPQGARQAPVTRTLLSKEKPNVEEKRRATAELDG